MITVLVIIENPVENLYVSHVKNSHMLNYYQIKVTINFQFFRKYLVSPDIFIKFYEFNEENLSNIR